MRQLTYLSLGWGIQSWTMAAMAALGEIQKPDYLIHADTTWEYQHTYQFAKKYTPWLESKGLKVITVDDAFTAKRIADPNDSQMLAPVHTINIEGKAGHMIRSCSERWKIRPQKRFISQVLSDRGMKKKSGCVKCFIGFSQDEALRAKDSTTAYIKNEYPLLDKRMSRNDCGSWLESKGLEVPKKSSCVFCPYHSNVAWQRLRANGGEDWTTAVMVDDNIRCKRKVDINDREMTYETDLGFMVTTKCKPKSDYHFFVHRNLKPLRDLEEVEEQGNIDINLKYATCDSGACFL